MKKLVSPPILVIFFVFSFALFIVTSAQNKSCDVNLPNCYTVSLVDSKFFQNTYSLASNYALSNPVPCLPSSDLKISNLVNLKTTSLVNTDLISQISASNQSITGSQRIGQVVKQVIAQPPGSLGNIGTLQPKPPQIINPKPTSPTKPNVSTNPQPSLPPSVNTKPTLPPPPKSPVNPPLVSPQFPAPKPNERAVPRPPPICACRDTFMLSMPLPPNKLTLYDSGYLVFGQKFSLKGNIFTLPNLGNSAICSQSTFSIQNKYSYRIISYNNTSISLFVVRQPNSVSR